MASILVRHRACSIPWSRLSRKNPITPGKSYGALTLRNVNLCFQLNFRFFSAAARSYYPRPSRRHRNRNVSEEDTTKQGKDILTQAQEDLEKAAKVVTEADKDIIKKLGHNAPFEIYVKLVLSRLRPFLHYFVLLGSDQFLKGYGPPTSSLARGRNATIFLFISAHAWLFHAVAALSSHSPDIPPEMVAISKKFTNAGNVVEAYVEDKLPEGMGWAEVGGAIVDSSSDAWLVMSKTISQDDRATAPSNKHDPSNDSHNKADDIT